jgi:GrpB-like predicted nucleotidyltransferase (UPF0157 family)
MLRFRDHLRRDDADRWLYQRTKRELAAWRWTYAQQYADAKSPVIEEILGRALRTGTFATGTAGAATASDVKDR